MMILPVFDGYIQQETWRHHNEKQDWPEVVIQNSDGDRLEVHSIMYDSVLNQVVVIPK